MSAVAVFDTGAAKLWQAAQWIVSWPILPSLTFVVSWHSAWPQVWSEVANWCTDDEWHCTHFKPWSCGASDSRWTLCPADREICSHFPGSPPMWHSAQRSFGTSACVCSSSGCSMIWVSAIVLRAANVGWWHALQPRSRWALCANRSYGSRIRWQERQKSLSCWT